MDMTVNEDAGTINVPVTLAQEIAVPVTVDIALVNGTAMEGEGQFIFSELKRYEHLEHIYASS